MTKPGILLLMATIALALTACASAEELRARDDAACQSYGFHPGTNDFAACVQRETLARQYYWSAPYAYDGLPGYAPYGY
jgi:hypothetical protein